MKQKHISLLTAAVMLASMTACGADTPAQKPGAVLAAEITPKAADELFCEQQAAFALDLYPERL